MPMKQRKIVVMGYPFVGKSSLSVQFAEGTFVETYEPTIVNTFTKLTKLDSQDFEIKVVDTAGQDEYTPLTSQFGIDIHGYVLVYSITSKKSFEVIKKLYANLLDITGKVNLPILLVGNKADLDTQRAISLEQGKMLAKQWNAVFVEVSAKENDDVLSIFKMLLKEIERADGNFKDKSACTVL